MKKLLLSVFVLINISLFAQIPNAGLECWTSHAGPPAYEEPCQWTSYDSSSQYGYPICVLKTTDNHSGSYALEVRTVAYSNPFPPFNPLVDVGYAQTGTNYQNGPNGFPDAVRHTTFSAWVKYIGQGVDSAEIKIKLTKWNAAAFPPQQDVATARFYVSSATDTNWHCRTGTFVYVAPFTISGNPDTATVIVQSSYQNSLNAGCIVRVDDISFGNSCNPTDVTEPEHSELPGLYPNPAVDNVSFSKFPPGADRIKLFEITGKMVAVEAVSGRSSVNLDVRALSTGVYLYGMYDENNKIVSSGKFSIVR